MSPEITFFSNNTTVPTPDIKEIIMEDHMILIIDGVEFTKQKIKDNAIDLRILKNQLKKIQGEYNAKRDKESSN